MCREKHATAREIFPRDYTRSRRGNRWGRAGSDRSLARWQSFNNYCAQQVLHREGLLGRGVLNGKKKVFRFPKKARGHSMCSTMVGGSWRLAVGSGWRLAVGNWRLVAVGGGWRRLVAGGWWLEAVGSGWQLAVGRRWRLAAVGGWRLVAVGGWRLVAVGS